jgi:hypothetical protein
VVEKVLDQGRHHPRASGTWSSRTTKRKGAVNMIHEMAKPILSNEIE